MTTYIRYGADGWAIGVYTQDTDAGIPDSVLQVDDPSTWAPKPSPAYKLRVVNGVCGWHDPRSLSDAQAAKWEEIKAARTAELDAPLQTTFGDFDCKPQDRANIADAIALMGLPGGPSSVTFTTHSNTVVELTKTQMTMIGLFLGQKTQAAYTKARGLRTQIEMSTTVTDVDAITW